MSQDAYLPLDEVRAGAERGLERLGTLAGKTALVIGAGDLGAAAAFGLGHLDVLVLAFGVNVRGPAAELAPERWSGVVDTNLTGVFFCCRAAYPLLKADGGGRVVVIASAAAHAARKWPPTAAYGASKAGAAQLVRFLGVEWATDGITVNALSPGYFRTRLTAPLVADKSQLERLLELTPMARLGVLEEFVGPLLFLASDASSFMTGQALVVDGGRVAV